MTFWQLFAAYSRQLTANSSIGSLNVARWLLPLCHLKSGKTPTPFLTAKNHMEDLLSYLMFDGRLAAALIELGRADADAAREDLIEFFRDD